MNKERNIGLFGGENYSPTLLAKELGITLDIWKDPARDGGSSGIAYYSFPVSDLKLRLHTLIENKTLLSKFNVSEICIFFNDDESDGLIDAEVKLLANILGAEFRGVK